MRWRVSLRRWWGGCASGESAGHGDGLRWTAPESWHITLQFLGNATAEQLQCLTARLGEVRSAAVAVQLGELGCFDRAGVFFVDVAVTPELAALERSVVAATSRCGFVAEARPFHPHITLARAKGAGDEERDCAKLQTREFAKPARIHALHGARVSAV